MDTLANRPADKHVQLMVTCLCDSFFGDAARASVEVLEWLGVKVDFPEDQTCCGQPAFNAGDWKASRKVVRHNLSVFAGEVPIIVPSGSCAAMLFHGAPLEFEQEPDLPAVEAMARRTWELVDYIVNGLGVKEWPGRFPHRVAFHRSCHTRGTQTGPAVNQLLGSIDGLTLTEFGEQEQCCGFGGTFSVSFPNISQSMGSLKIEHIRQGDPDYLAAVDMGCGLHLGGIIDKRGMQLPRIHVAQILRDSLKNAGEL